MSLSVNIHGVREVTVTKMHSPRCSDCSEYMKIQIDIKAIDYEGGIDEYRFDLFLENPGFTVRKLSDSVRIIEVRK